MNKRNIVLLICVCIVGIIFSIHYGKESTQKQPDRTYSATEYLPVVIGGVSVSLPFSSGDTFYEILIHAQQSGRISFSGKTYPGIGFFVTDIGSLHEHDGLHLMYFINGKEASVGVSSYVPHQGDEIVWNLQ